MFHHFPDARRRQRHQDRVLFVPGERAHHGQRETGQDRVRARGGNCVSRRDIRGHWARGPELQHHSLSGLCLKLYCTAKPRLNMKETVWAILKYYEQAIAKC